MSGLRWAARGRYTTIDLQAKKSIAKERKLPANVLMTDQQVLECRESYERHNATPMALAVKYNTSIDYMRRLLSYETRSKLIPEYHRV